MSKAFDEWWSSIVEYEGEWREGIALRSWNAAISAAAKLLEAKAAELSVPDLATGAKWVRELAEEK